MECHSEMKKMKSLINTRAWMNLRHYAEGKKLDTQTINNITVYFTVYAILFMVLLLLISVDNFDFETNFTAITACYNNIGPGLAGVGPASNFAGYSVFSKIVLSVAMLLGRLEIFPILLIFTPHLWKRK